MSKKRRRRNSQKNIFAQHPIVFTLIALGLLYWGYKTVSTSRQLTAAA